jgi:hypothetical protein
VNLYKISYPWPKRTYDVYLSAVVAAESPEAARRVHPDPLYVWDAEAGAWGCVSPWPLDWLPEHAARDRARAGETWPSDIEQVEIALLGTAQSDIEPGVVHASFRHG